LVEALKSKTFKVITITHGESAFISLMLPTSSLKYISDDRIVDTSTGVLSPAARFSKLIKEHSPDSLIVLDSVCSVASEEIRFDDWGIDLVISATQKGLGAPPGMNVLMASGRAIKVSALCSSESF
jgi:alanine-glyoxylate transaminase/serine-glyoxylate transaminase/serine-pyruvate transaminase